MFKLYIGEREKFYKYKLAVKANYILKTDEPAEDGGGGGRYC